MFSFKVMNGKIDIESCFLEALPVTVNPIPSEAKEGDYYERKDGRRKYILDIE